MHNNIQKLIDGLTDQLLQAEMQAKATNNEIDKGFYNGFYNGYYSACKKHREELILLLEQQPNTEPSPQLQQTHVSGALPSKCIAPLGGRFGCDFPDDSCEKCRVGNDR